MDNEDKKPEASAELGGRVDSVVMRCCPSCAREWPENCEQAICIELHNECQVCRFTPIGCGSEKGTADELLEIVDLYERRQADLKQEIGITGDA